MKKKKPSGLSRSKNVPLLPLFIKRYIGDRLARYSILFIVFSLLLPLSIYSVNRESEKEEIASFSLDELLNVEIVVAGKKAQKLSEAPAIVSVLTGDEIRDMGVNTLHEALAYIPGVDITDTYFGFTTVNFRGIKQSHYNNKNLLLINDHPMFDAVSGSYFLEQVPLNLIKQVEIIRGPGSTLYGTNAYAGVIKVVTKSGKDLDGNAEVELSGGSFSTIQAGAVYGNQWKDFQLSSAFNYRYSDGYEYNVTEDEEGNSSNFDYQNNFMTGWLSMSYKKLIVNLGFYNQEKDKLGLIPILVSTGEKERKGFAADIALNVPAGKNLRLNFLAYYDWLDLLEVFEWYPPSQALKDLGIGEKEHGGYTSFKTGVEVQGFYDFSEETHLIVGALYEYQDTTPYLNTIYNTDIISPFKSSPFQDGHTSYDISSYLQIDTKLWKKLGLVGGIRYIKNKNYGSKFAPRGGIVYNASKELSFKLLYGNAFRNPSILEKYIDAPNIIYGNEDLNPEEINTLDIGFDLLVDKNNSLRVNYFHTSTNDLVTRYLIVPAGERENTVDTPMYGNSAGERFNGVEVEWKGSLKKQFLYFLNFSYAEGEGKLECSKVEFIPNWQASCGLTWKSPGKLSKFSVSTYMKYTGKRDGHLVNGDYTETDAFLLWNMNLKLNLSKRLTLKLIGKNLVDSEYFYPEYVRRILPQIPGGPGRSVYLKLLYKLL
jgi:outer membrane receptor for ferrienterochelin and colicins